MQRRSFVNYSGRIAVEVNALRSRNHLQEIAGLADVMLHDGMKHPLVAECRVRSHDVEMDADLERGEELGSEYGRELAKLVIMLRRNSHGKGLALGSGLIYKGITHGEVSSRWEPVSKAAPDRRPFRFCRRGHFDLIAIIPCAPTARIHSWETTTCCAPSGSAAHMRYLDAEPPRYVVGQLGSIY
jgi:hypothetical protein